MSEGVTASTATTAIAVLDRAAALEKLAASFEERMHRQDDLTGLSSRKETLTKLATRIGTLARVYELLRDHSGISTGTESAGPLARAKGEAAPLLSIADRLAGEIAAQPRVLLKQKVLEGFVAERASREPDKLQPLEAAIVAAWSAFIGPTGSTGPEQVLGNYPAFRTVHDGLSVIRKKLAKLGEALPASKADLELVLQLRQDRTAQLESLKGKGLDEDVVSFLTRSLEGVRLGELLANQKVLVWLSEQGLTDAFLVKATTIGERR